MPEPAPAVDEAQVSASVIREVDPAEQMLALQECLIDDGWDVNLNEERQVVMNYPVEQREAADASLARCRAQYPLKEKFRREWGEEQYGLLYDHWVNETIPCVKEAGYVPDEPPGRERFIELGVAGQGLGYSMGDGFHDELVHDVLSGRWESERSFWKDVCPDEPPEDVLYGPD